MATSAEMVKAVKAYAIKNYDKGWDVVVECYSDADIAATINEAKARTTAGAIKKMWAFIRPSVDYAAEIRSTAF